MTLWRRHDKGWATWQGAAPARSASFNGLGISGGAPIDRYWYRAESNLQKSDDLAGATRRPLHARVGRQSGTALQMIVVYG